MRLRNITLAALALIAASCTNDNEPGAGIDLTGQPMRVTTQVNAPQTRESMTTTDLTKYYLRITGDQGATTLYDYFTTMTIGGTEWTPADELTWKDNTTPIEVSAVSQGDITWNKDEYNGTVPKTVSVLTDQGTEANVKASDLLYMEPTDVNPATLEAPYTIPVTLSHRFAKLNITIRVGSSAETTPGTNPISTVTVGGTQTQATFVPADNTFNLTSNTAADITAALAVDYAPGTDVADLGSATYECILLPQTADFTVTANINNTNYIYTGNAQQFDPDRQYNLTLTVSGIGNSMNLGGATVGDWGDEEDLGSGDMGEDLGGYTIAKDGTYQVYNADGLMAWAEAVQSDPTLNCTLMNDIDLTGKTWPKIGSNTQNYAGIFDGQGHSISHLTGSCGLIYTGNGCTIRNVTLINPQITNATDYYGGGIAGGITNSTLTNCHVVGGTLTSNLNGNVRIGGIAGSINGTTSIVRACSSSASLFFEGSTNYSISMGGLTGCLDSGTLSGCYYAHGSLSNTGSATNVSIGSIAGGFNKNALSDCYWSGGVNEPIGLHYGYGTATNIYQVGSADCANWAAAAEAMNAALTEASYTDYRWVVNTGDDANSRPLITEKATE